MNPIPPYCLSRTSSMSSLGSDDSFPGSATCTSNYTVKRTRKRFTSVQLIVLEHLYRKVSHPSREQREQAAKQADIDIRSVTVWFQNKRQTDRRLHRQLSSTPPVHFPPPLSPCSPLPLPPSSPFSGASGNTIHTFRERGHTLCFDSTATAKEMSRQHDQIDVQEPKSLSRHVRQWPSRHPSLDDVAARTEQCPSKSSQPQTAGPATLPLCSVPRDASPVTPEHKHKPTATSATGDNGENEIEANRVPALWEYMLSSPESSSPSPRAEREIVRAGRRNTLEYACARELVGEDGSRRRGRRRSRSRSSVRKDKHRKESLRVGDADGEKPDRDTYKARLDRVLGRGSHSRTHTTRKESIIAAPDYDAHGDTDTEGAFTDPPTTPASTFALGELRNMTDDEESDCTVTMRKTNLLVGRERKKKNGNEPMTVEIARSGPDDELMDAAFVLCGLSQRR